MPLPARPRRPAPAVHFTSPKLQESAGLIGKEAPHLYTLARDGALFAWTYRKSEEVAAAPAVPAGRHVPNKRRRLAQPGEGGEQQQAEEGEEQGGSSSEEDEEGGSGSGGSSEEEEPEEQQAGAGQPAAAAAAAAPEQSLAFAGGHWKLTEKHYFNQRGARLSAAAFQGGAGLLAVGFTHGIFELLQLPDLTTVHTLSIGR